MFLVPGYRGKKAPRRRVLSNREILRRLERTNRQYIELDQYEVQRAVARSQAREMMLRAVREGAYLREAA